MFFLATSGGQSIIALSVPAFDMALPSGSLSLLFSLFLEHLFYIHRYLYFDSHWLPITAYSSTDNHPAVI